MPIKVGIIKKSGAMMKDHYGFSDEAYESLQKAGVTDMDLFKCVKYFDPHDTGTCLKSKISIFNYIDKKRDWNKPPKKLKHKLIAKALFESLEIKADEKLQILQYVEEFG